MGISQTFLIIGIFLTPYIAEKSLSTLGFRNTLWIMTISAIIIFLTVGVLQPVKWHMRRIYDEETTTSEYTHLYV